MAAAAAQILAALKDLKAIREIVKTFGIQKTLMVTALLILYFVPPSPEKETYEMPSSICWERFLDSWVGNLSGATYYSDHIYIFESYSAANLICGKKKTDVLFKMTERTLETESLEKRQLIFQNTHLELLADHIAMTAEECFPRFCRIFLAKSKYAGTGLDLCKLCEACCSTVLNGTWSNESISCSVSTELELPLNVSFNNEQGGTARLDLKDTTETNRNTVKEDESRSNVVDPMYVESVHAVHQTSPPPSNLFDDDVCERKDWYCLAVHKASHLFSEEGNLSREKESTATIVNKGINCDKWFRVKEEEIRKNFYPVVIRVVTTDKDDCERKDRRCLFVHEASLSCTEEGIIAYLRLNVEQEAVDQAKLKAKLASATGSNPSEIRLQFGPKSSTSVLLLLSPQAGMELLAIIGNSEKKRLFLNALSSAVCSPMDYVSVLVQISALQPVKMFFVPKEAKCMSRFLQLY